MSGITEADRQAIAQVERLIDEIETVMDGTPINVAVSALVNAIKRISADDADGGDELRHYCIRILQAPDLKSTDPDRVWSVN